MKAGYPGGSRRWPRYHMRGWNCGGRLGWTIWLGGEGPLWAIGTLSGHPRPYDRVAAFDPRADVRPIAVYDYTWPEAEWQLRARKGGNQTIAADKRRSNYRPESDTRRSGSPSEQRAFRDDRSRPVCAYVGGGGPFAAVHKRRSGQPPLGCACIICQKDHRSLQPENR